MQTTAPQNEATYLKVFTVASKPTMRRVWSSVDPSMHEQLDEIARYEGLRFDATIRELLILGLRFYKHKKGTLNPDLPQNKKTFYCQSCKAETKIRDVIYKTLDFDQYLICEGCMFNRDKLKSFVSKVLQGL